MIGNGAQKDLFVETIKREKIENRFILINEITNVNKYYSAFDYFILPSLFEGLPVVCVEAQANGLPCLLSNTISDECKISNNIYYIDKQSIDDWVRKINHVKRNNQIDLNDDFNICIQARNFQNCLLNVMNDNVIKR